MKILAGVLTYNRLTLLKRCLLNICNQSLKPTNILVINNGSTDGTEDFLNQNKHIIKINKKKSGSAEGWFEMINYALIHNYDYIWMMDDDGYPAFNSLEKLAKNISPKHACLSSVVVNEVHTSKLVFAMPISIFNNNKYKINYFFKINNINKLRSLCKDKILNHCHLFNGSLINMNSIRYVGNVDRQFYHHGVEVDFYLRLKKAGCVDSYLEAFHYHPDVAKRKINNLWIYYYIKNSMIINYKYMNMPFLRNFYVLIKFFVRLFLRNGIKNSFFILINFKDKIVYKAIIDGYSNKLGATYIEK